MNKNLSILTLVALIFTVSTSTAFASSTTEVYNEVYSTNTEEQASLDSTSKSTKDWDKSLIEEYVQTIDEHNWEEFADLHIVKEKDNLESFFANPANEAEHNGILNVQTASLKELVEININDVTNMLYEVYDPANVKVFIFGVDYSVYVDSKYYSSGINYNFITYVEENGNWKVVEMIPIADPERILELGYELSTDYYSTINVMDARQQGYLVNYDGETFAALNEETMNEETMNEDTMNEETMNEETSSESTSINLLPQFSIKNQRTLPTSSTTIRYKNSSSTIQKLNFHDYCLGVLAGELRHTDYDGTVRRAQAIAIKTFTWHYKIVPQGATEGYDVNSSQQSYQPTKVSENKKVTTDYNAVKDIWMESNGGAIFTAYYKLGVYSDQKNHKNGGEFKQKGAKWLIDNKKASTYYDLLHYYYDSSSASTDGVIRFFDKDKNEI